MTTSAIRAPKRIAFTVALLMGLGLAATDVSPARGASGYVTGGSGSQTHVGAPFQPPIDNGPLAFPPHFNDPNDNDVCLTYSQYSSSADVANSGSATVTITNGASSGTHSQSFTMTAGTAPTTVWAEGPHGTYASPTSTLVPACLRSTAGFPVPLSRFDIAPDTPTGTVTCMMTPDTGTAPTATYSRVDTTVTYTARSITCSAGSVTDPDTDVTVILTLTACTPSIWPATCNYDVDSVSFDNSPPVTTTT